MILNFVNEVTLPIIFSTEHAPNKIVSLPKELCGSLPYCLWS